MSSKETQQCHPQKSAPVSASAPTAVGRQRGRKSGRAEAAAASGRREKRAGSGSFGRTGGVGGALTMDQAYVQGLRDAKLLLDDGIFTQEEFAREKETLLKQREERAAERAKLGAAAFPLKGKRVYKKGGQDPKATSKWAKYRKKCIHGKDAYECRACGGKRLCVHNKRRTKCPECSTQPLSAQPCPPASSNPMQAIPPPPPGQPQDAGGMPSNVQHMNRPREGAVHAPHGKGL
jgi:hypothetical protein